jgi:diguanylate cyclase (GGDEF)-like protein/PAS domain S-box-containing protein
MSLAAQAATTVVALSAAVAAVSLWRGANRHTGSVRRAYRILALTPLLWGAGTIAQQALASASAGATFPFTLADLPGLLALPALVAGLASLGSRREAARHPLAQRHRARVGTAVARGADGYVVASALFIIGWITVLSAGYVRSGDDAGTFAAELIHPLADLLVLGAVLPLAVAAGRRGVAPVLALVAVSASDMLSVGAEITNGHPGVAAQLLLVAAFCVLGCAPWLGDSWRVGPADAAQFTRARAHVTTMLAAVSAAAAALVLIGWVLAGNPSGKPVLALVTGTALLALTARVVILVHRDSIRSRLWHESGQQFRELADRISDVVLVCDYGGAISYASPTVRDYGYTPVGLEGQVLADLVHPEDRLGALRAVREAASVPGAPAQPVRYSCRVRAADGTWRYVEATISRHRSQGAPDRLLVTSRDVSDQVALRRQIAHLTYHDGLTGLPNRAYLEERAREVLSYPDTGTPGVPGVILVDLDAFTSVNDAAGPSAGDLVLAQVARRLRASVPPRGTVARWGGDVFAVLIQDASSGEIVELAQRILVSVAAEPFRAADRSVALSASVGVALADGSPAGYVWRNADAAVSRAKEAGGGRLEVFPALPYPGSQRRLSLAAQLSRALSHGLHGEAHPAEDEPGEGGLELAYRPIADLASSRVIGAEALPRWRGDEADVPRQEFLAAAETARVTVELGDWMLRESCAQAAAWWRDGWEASLWLRCPASQLVGPFADSVLAALAGSGLAPYALVLEVPAPVLGEGGEAVLRGLGELRERGVRLAVDVSAAGYGSLARLGHHPVDLVRIGPDLVAGLGVDAAAEILIKALVRVGKDLGIPVVADGIERAEQRDLLAAMGCTLGLGPFVAAPVSPASLPALAGGQGRGGGMAAGPGLAGEMAGGRGRTGEMAGGPGLGGERLAGEHLAGECLAGERGGVDEHGAGGEQGPAGAELPFGDVITPARHLAS